MPQLNPRDIWDVLRQTEDDGILQYQRKDTERGTPLPLSVVLLHRCVARGWYDLVDVYRVGTHGSDDLPPATRWKYQLTQAGRIARIKAHGHAALVERQAFAQHMARRRT